MSNTISIINQAVESVDNELTITGSTSGYTREEIRTTQLKRISYSWN